VQAPSGDRATRPAGGRSPRHGWALVGLALAVVASAFALRQLGSGDENALDATGRIHRELRQELDAIPLPAELVVAADQDLGVATCFFGDCPKIERYYTSPWSIDETCQKVSDSLRASGVGDLTTVPETPCAATGTRGELYLRFDVAADAEGSPEPGQLPRNVTAPHKSVLIIEAQRNGPEEE
jgi:hypothetical protein